jgi:hypothetical protein
VVTIPSAIVQKLGLKEGAIAYMDLNVEANTLTVKFYKQCGNGLIQARTAVKFGRAFGDDNKAEKKT